MKYSAWQGLKIKVFTKVEQKQNKTPLATVIDTLKVYSLLSRGVKIVKFSTCPGTCKWP